MNANHQSMMPVFCLLLGIPLSLHADTEKCTSDCGLYHRKTTLTDTMLATRASYVTWLAEQKPARKAVTCGPWMVRIP